jgi:cyclin-dependent kinase 7
MEAPPDSFPIESSPSPLDFFGGDKILSVPKASFTRGAFGEISLGILQSESSAPRVVAIKTFFRATLDSNSITKSLNNNLCPEVIHEITALRKLSPHENIVHLLALYPSSTGYSLSMAFEYCPTDLALTLEWRRRCFLPLLSITVVQGIARDLFAALNFVHQHNYLHLDIKPANLLVTSTGRVQLCDFGLSQPSPTATASVSDPNNNKQAAAPRGLCTLHYRPPEILLGCSPDHAAVDMYSAGTVLAEILLGRPLWADRTVLGQLTRIFQALGTPTEETWADVADSTPDFHKFFFQAQPAKSMRDILPRAGESQHLEDLLTGLITLDPAKRLTSMQAAQHAWLQSSSSTDADTDGSTRQRMVEELVPHQLEEPLLLLSRPLSNQFAQVTALALRRRTVFVQPPACSGDFLGRRPQRLQ